MPPKKPTYRKSSMFAKSLKVCIEPVTRPLLKSQGLAGNRILEEWEQIVGTKLAAHTIPEKLTFIQGKKTDGTLVIACESAHALELQHLQPVILERLAGYFGYRAVSRISINQRLARPLEQVARKNKMIPVRLDTNCLKDIDDTELQQALSGFAGAMAAPDK